MNPAPYKSVQSYKNDSNRSNRWQMLSKDGGHKNSMDIPAECIRANLLQQTSEGQAVTGEKYTNTLWSALLS